MEETYYYMKARTAWTFSHWFQDASYWEDSLLIDGVPPSFSLVKEEESQQSLTSVSYGSTESAMTIDESENLDKCSPGEFPRQPSAVTLRASIDEGAGFGTSNNDQSVSFPSNDSSSTSFQRKHVCSICEKTFRVPSQLVAHLRIHSGDKPFECTQCSYQCSQRSNLTKHLRTHTGEKPFTCDVCHKSFSASGSLKDHRRIHTNEKPFTCTTCGRLFARNSLLKVHLLTHTEEKPHKCEHCGKCFSQKSHLKVHTRTHTGEKPYDCQTCGKTFAQSTNLIRHSRHCTSTTTIKLDLLA